MLLRFLLSDIANLSRALQRAQSL